MIGDRNNVAHTNGRSSCVMGLFTENKLHGERWRQYNTNFEMVSS